MNLNLDQDSFLKDFWQKKPLFIKNAIANFRSPHGVDELASLAMEEMVNSRLVMANDRVKTKDDYQVEEGPFSEEKLNSLNERWNLLIQEADHWSEEILALRSFFDFIPHWRFDDVMVSMGGKHGQVGAHLDWYDVFILQAEGKKKWRLEKNPRTFEQFEGDHLVEDLDVKLLSDFNPESEYEMEPGDLLYIPSGYAHQGVNQSSCLSFSFGYRAPTLREMITEQLKEDLGEIHEDERMKDAPETWLKQGQIPEDIVVSLIKNWPSSLKLPNKPHHWFGKLVTTPSRHEVVPPDSLSDEELWNALENQKLFQNPHARFAYYQGKHDLCLFANGESLYLPLSAENLFLLEMMANQLNFSEDEFLKLKEHPSTVMIIRFLYNVQALILDS